MMLNLVLYNFALSTCSQKVRLCLGEKGLDYEDRQVDLAREEHLTPEYLALNPNGVVPTLLVDGVPVVDSSVICEYLDECFPDPPLSPADPIGRAGMRAWMRYLEEVPTAAIRVPSFNRLFDKSFTSQSLNEAAHRRPLREQLYKEMGVNGFSDDKVAASLKRLRQTAERVEAALVDKGPWLCGDQFTIADIVLVPSVVRLDDLGLQHVWSGLNHFQRWYDRVQARPAFSYAYRPGSRLTDDAIYKLQPTNLG